ncbi:MAG: hypothetical protein ACQXXJ_08420 [Candidatus Bathyarchaeia archaeon]
MRKSVPAYSLQSCFCRQCSSQLYTQAPDIERHIFIHYAKGAKPNPPAAGAGYYKLLGAKWETLPVVLEVNPENSYGLDENFVRTFVGLAAEEWDDGAYSMGDGDPLTRWAGGRCRLNFS